MSPEESQKIVNFILDNWVWFLGFIGAAIGCIYTVAMHKFKLDRVCKDVEEINKRIDSSLTSIIDMLSGNVLIKNKTAKSNSPVTYTDKGLKLLGDSQFPTFFETKKGFFIDLITQKEIEDESSLDKACWEVMFNLEDEEIVDALRAASYKNGFPEPALRKLCAIYMREELKEDLLPQISQSLSN